RWCRLASGCSNSASSTKWTCGKLPTWPPWSGWRPLCGCGAASEAPARTVACIVACKARARAPGHRLSSLVLHDDHAHHAHELMAADGAQERVLTGFTEHKGPAVAGIEDRGFKGGGRGAHPLARA